MFKRVSRKCPCRICGKPDWCSTTRTETISFCARSVFNADRVSRYGWGVYYHDGSGAGFDFNCNFDINRALKRPTRRKNAGSKKPASPVIRDKVYRKLIELSPSSSNHKIVNGRGGLSERGIDDHSLYGSLPRRANERRVLVERLVEALAKRGIHSFQEIPGFWRNSTGSLRLWSEHDSFEDLMLIPFVGPDGLVRACQIRFMRYIPNKPGRYVWLSSSKQKDGCGPRAPLHHADPSAMSATTVLVTEGALKAATAQRLIPNICVIGNSGVATSHKEIVKTARGRTLEIAFDADCFTNPHVARSLATLIALRIREQQFLRCDHPTRLLTWDKHFKGIDDALLAGAPLNQLNVREWLNKLTPECLAAATAQLNDLMPLE